MTLLLRLAPIRSLTLVHLRTLSTHGHSSRDYYHRRKPHSSRGPPPPPDPAKLERAISQLPPRFTPDDLTATLSSQRDPNICLHIFQWATHQSRFKPHTSTYLVTIKKLGSTKMYTAMDFVINQAMAVASSIASEELFNTMIYFYSEARMLSRAVGVYKKMRDSDDLSCRPTLRTYNLLFAALLSREGNSFINHMYMDNIRCLFRQMVDGGIEPDIHALNTVIKGYVLSMHVNDALRVFHQMGVAYQCVPDENTYNYIIHGLCSQGRTKNARELVEEMKGKGFVPGDKSYNSLANASVLAGEIDAAVGVLWEMVGLGRQADFVTYRTVLGEICRVGKVDEAVGLLRELRRKGVVDGNTWKELMVGLQDEYGDVLDGSNGFRRR